MPDIWRRLCELGRSLVRLFWRTYSAPNPTGPPTVTATGGTFRVVVSGTCALDSVSVTAVLINQDDVDSPPAAPQTITPPYNTPKTCRTWSFTFDNVPGNPLPAKPYLLVVSVIDKLGSSASATPMNVRAV